MSSALRFVFRSAAIPRAALASTRVQTRFVLPQRAYASSAGLGKDGIQKRVLDVLKGFERVDQTKLTPTAAFVEDLGLDSLDAVEVVMAVEEEFSIEIPDAEADEIKTVQQAIDYISNSPEAH